MTKPTARFMTGEDYKAAIEAIGLSVRSARKFLNIDESTSRRYRSGASGVPKPIALLLRVMVARKLKAADVEMEALR